MESEAEMKPIISFLNDEKQKPTILLLVSLISDLEGGRETERMCLNMSGMSATSCPLLSSGIRWQVILQTGLIILKNIWVLCEHRVKYDRLNTVFFSPSAQAGVAVYNLEEASYAGVIALDFISI